MNQQPIIEVPKIMLSQKDIDDEMKKEIQHDWDVIMDSANTARYKVLEPILNLPIGAIIIDKKYYYECNGEKYYLNRSMVENNKDYFEPI